MPAWRVMFKTSVYQVGTVGAPEISDIDCIAVLPERQRIDMSFLNPLVFPDTGLACWERTAPLGVPAQPYVVFGYSPCTADWKTVANGIGMRARGSTARSRRPRRWLTAFATWSTSKRPSTPTAEDWTPTRAKAKDLSPVAPGDGPRRQRPAVPQGTGLADSLQGPELKRPVGSGRGGPFSHPSSGPGPADRPPAGNQAARGGRLLRAAGLR